MVLCGSPMNYLINLKNCSVFHHLPLDHLEIFHHLLISLDPSNDFICHPQIMNEIS